MKARRGDFRGGRSLCRPLPPSWTLRRHRGRHFLPPGNPVLPSSPAEKLLPTVGSTISDMLTLGMLTCMAKLGLRGEHSHAGVDGFNIVAVTTLGWRSEFVDDVVPVLQKRGLMQTRYRKGTLRENFFAKGPTLPARQVVSVA